MSTDLRVGDVHTVHDWAEVLPLHERVRSVQDPYTRDVTPHRRSLPGTERATTLRAQAKGPLLDPFKADISEVLVGDAEATAAVILEALQGRGDESRITIQGDPLGLPEGAVSPIT